MRGMLSCGKQRRSAAVHERRHMKSYEHSHLSTFLVCTTVVVGAVALAVPGDDRAANPSTREKSGTLTLARPLLPDHPVPPWLMVLSPIPDAKGGWAKGSFDAERNRFTIDTFDVEAFSIDTSALQIDWSKLVILRLDGRNTELGRKENPVITFTRGTATPWETLAAPSTP